MSSEQIAIRVTNLSKCYQIYDKPEDRLKQSIIPKFQSLFRRQPSQYFREFWALREIAFEIKRGETVGIVGRNGSGKSTLLQIICGTLTPTSGLVDIHGRVAALLELGSGFNPEFTGRENVYLNASVLGLNKQEIDARFDDIAAFADIGEFIEQPVKTYSSGMAVRLAFAVIAHVDADILVIDEALAVGDAFFTQKCMRFLRDYMKAGTVIFVSHDTSAVVNLCKKAILLEHGEVLKRGTPKDVTEYYLATLQEFSPEPVSTDETNSPSGKSQIGQSEFGTGDAKIISIQLLNKESLPLAFLVGGEEIVLEIHCLAYKEIICPIIGFQFKDRLGQVIFADNTSICQSDLKPISPSNKLIAKFAFCLPILPSGDYSITAAIAAGSDDSHVQHHWIHDGLIVRVHSPSVCFGLVGVPMKEISLTIE